jgi:SIR2-like domain
LSRILLTGAGFSHNWGGWLANEAFEYLLGCSVVTSVIATELWKAKATGAGFEGALESLRGQYATYKDVRHETELKTFESMLLGMFNTMNSSYATVDFEPGRDPARLGPQPTLVRDFLCRFDKIFTLNQDTLLEQHYQHSDLLGGSTGRWFALQTPGLEEMKIGGKVFEKPGVHTPTKPPFAVSDRNQPYFKLHGSSNWRTEDGSSLLIMGGNKSANIAASELLSWYAQEFCKALREPGARLMVIGYGFADTHINGHIREGAAAGMKLFVIDPNGVDVIDTLRPRGIYNFGSSLEGSFIGASRRGLLTTLTRDTVERAKVMRFFP